MNILTYFCQVSLQFLASKCYVPRTHCDCFCAVGKATLNRPRIATFSYKLCIRIVRKCDEFTFTFLNSQRCIQNRVNQAGRSFLRKKVNEYL